MGGSQGDAGNKRRKGHGIREIEYGQLESQKKFHDSEARFKGFSGPVGSGKSAALCHEAIRLTYLNAGRTGLIGAPTYPMLRDTTQAALIEILRTNEIPHTWNRAENVLVMGDSNSRILFRAVEEFERLRGSNLAWFGVDELTYTSEDAWLRLEARLRDPKAERLCGFGVWTPKGFDWVYERFIANPVEGYETVVAGAFENQFLLDRIPDYYERLKSSYDPRFYEQEALGNYLSMNSGRVYYAFERTANVGAVEVNARLPLMWALDFNVDPMCSVVAQVVGERVNVVDEIVLGRASTKDACEEFARRFESHRSGLIVYADATGAHMQTASGTTDVTVLREFLKTGEYGEVQFKIPTSNPVVRERVMLVNAKLESAAGERMLTVDAKCRELIKDLDQVTYKEGSTQAIEKDRDSRRTHLSDALGYLIWQECRGAGTVGERGQRLV